MTKYGQGIGRFLRPLPHVRHNECSLVAAVVVVVVRCTMVERRVARGVSVSSVRRER